MIKITIIFNNYSQKCLIKERFVINQNVACSHQLVKIIEDVNSLDIYTHNIVSKHDAFINLNIVNVSKQNIHM